tara:strand:- start:310 stop:558 length:249 start_codon:yes stop_codon:yes gene_type:complete
MKYVLILILFFNGETNPKIFKYAYVDFLDENTCLLFKEKQGALLQQTIQKQFSNKEIKYQEMTCWNIKQWLEYNKTLQGVEA